MLFLSYTAYVTVLPGMSIGVLSVEDVGPTTLAAYVYLSVTPSVRGIEILDVDCVNWTLSCELVKFTFTVFVTPPIVTLIGSVPSAFTVRIALCESVVSGVIATLDVSVTLSSNAHVASPIIS